MSDSFWDLWINLIWHQQNYFAGHIFYFLGHLPWDDLPELNDFNLICFITNPWIVICNHLFCSSNCYQFCLKLYYVYDDSVSCLLCDLWTLTVYLVIQTFLKIMKLSLVFNNSFESVSETLHLRIQNYCHHQEVYYWCLICKTLRHFYLAQNSKQQKVLHFL